MMKDLLLLNVNNTVICFALWLVKTWVKKGQNYQNGSKRRSTRVKNLTIDRVWVPKRRSKGVENLTKKEVLPKMGQKGGQKGSKIYGSC